MESKLKIVQFSHPGKEHGHDKTNPNHKSWNDDEHKRKFLLSEGCYVDKNNQMQKGNIVFWGEWEPDSDVQPLNQLKPYYPKWLHTPYLPEILPPSTGYQKIYQNTDPCVFGDYFKYFVCKQYRQKTMKSTALATLDKGSLILFGSTANNAFFQLDTVFVVSDFIEYNPNDSNALSEYKLGVYRDFVFKMAFPKPIGCDLTLRLYKGATFDNPFEGMYSFSPAQIWNNQTLGFPRVPLTKESLKNTKYITNNLNAAPKCSTSSISEIKDLWTEIRNLSRKNGCVEGVKFGVNGTVIH